VIADDVVPTSGGRDLLRLAVGRVADSQRKTGFRNIKVEPSADMVRIEEVLIPSAPASAGLLGQARQIAAVIYEHLFLAGSSFPAMWRR
jgi:hypothetical protein